MRVWRAWLSGTGYNAGPQSAQPAKTTLFAGGNGADVRKSAAGDFFQ
jgi:hypothetical protein